MNPVLETILLYILTFITVVFAASIIAAILKFIFFYRTRFAYNRMLKLAMAGTGIGIAIVAAFDLPLVNILFDIRSEELSVRIPLWCMLVGLFAGTAITFYHKDRKQNHTAG